MSLASAVAKAVKPGYVVVRRLLSSTIIERRLGIETAREVDLGSLDLAAEGRENYEPSGWLVLRRILARHEVTGRDVFIDFGSGKGRIVYQAAQYPFRRVIGVEVSDELNAVAKRNLSRSGNRLRCRNIELVTTDALSYPIPDDLTVAYFYNPFRGNVFDAVIDKLVASLDRRPRPMRIIYRTPLEEGRLLQTGRFELIRIAPGFRPGRRWSYVNSTRMYRAIW